MSRSKYKKWYEIDLLRKSIFNGEKGRRFDKFNVRTGKSVKPLSFFFSCLWLYNLHKDISHLIPEINVTTKITEQTP